MKVYLPFLTLLIVGLVLFGYSHQLEYYHDEGEIEKLNDEAYDQLHSDNAEEFKEHYYRTADSLRTPKREYMDLGAGLCIFSSFLLLLFFGGKVRSWSDLLNLKTIRWTWVLLFVNVSWLMMIPGGYWYYSFRGARGDYPWFADSIGIPIMSSSVTVLAVLIPLNIIFGLGLWYGRLPTKLFIWSDKFNFQRIVIESIYIILLLGMLYVLVDFIIDGDHFSIPIIMATLYGLLCLRAGAIQKLLLSDEVNTQNV